MTIEMEENFSAYSELLKRHGCFTVFPRGISMRPLIREGQCCVTVVQAGEPRIGDIVAFTTMRDGKKIYLVHRCVGVEGDRYIMRGDNCISCEYASAAEIIGKVQNLCWTEDAKGLIPLLVGAKAPAPAKGRRACTDDAAYLLYTKLWMALWPLRKCRLKAIFHLRALARRK